MNPRLVLSISKQAAADDDKEVGAAESNIRPLLEWRRHSKNSSSCQQELLLRLMRECEVTCDDNEVV